MAVRAVVFDIGGVLERTPPTGWVEQWETQLQLEAGSIAQQLNHVWRAGSLGTMSEEEVAQQIGQILGLDQAQTDRLLADLWKEYLGELNSELLTYFASLRPRYKTAILSNSFVGARSKEHEAYQFGDRCDLIVYSHEEGMEKPDQRFFALICERLHIQPAEVVFLDDVEGHVAAARTYGFHGSVFVDTAQAIADLERCLRENA